MGSASISIELAGEEMILFADRAMYWPRRDALLIADTHWGKAATMRAAAIPIPRGTTSEDLLRLSRVVDQTGARQLVLLGDAIHARQGRSPDTLAMVTEWRARHKALDVLLIRGNHDERAGDPPEELGFRCVDAPMNAMPFVYRHQPSRSADGYTLCGHLHPAIRLTGSAGLGETLPCFLFTRNIGILPAFGSMTGKGKIKPRPGDRVYGIADGEVIAIM